MNPSLTDALCTECGLCCNGSLFSDIELGSVAEASAMECLGLKIEDAEEDEPALLLQPCGALKGTRCSVYAHRPRCCRTFECRLLQEVRRGMITLPDAKRTVAKTRESIDYVAALIGSNGSAAPLKERYFDALDLCRNQPIPPDGKDKCSELMTAMLAVETIISKNFLGS